MTTSLHLWGVPSVGKTFTVKTCKSRRHQYYGVPRCPACKKERDARWERSSKGRETRRIYRIRKKRERLYGRGAFVSGMASPPLYMPRGRIVAASVLKTTGL